MVTHYFADKQALLLAAVQDAYAAVAVPDGRAHRGPVPAVCRRCARYCWRRCHWMPSGAAEARVCMAFWPQRPAPPPPCGRSRVRATSSGGNWWLECWPRRSNAARCPTDLDPMDAGEQLMCLVDGPTECKGHILEPRRLPADRQIRFLDAALQRLARPTG